MRKGDVYDNIIMIIIMIIMIQRKNLQKAKKNAKHNQKTGNNLKKSCELRHEYQVKSFRRLCHGIAYESIK